MPNSAHNLVTVKLPAAAKLTNRCYSHMNFRQRPNFAVQWIHRQGPPQSPRA